MKLIIRIRTLLVGIVEAGSPVTSEKPGEAVNCRSTDDDDDDDRAASGWRLCVRVPHL